MQSSISYLIGALLLATSVGKASRLLMDPFADIYLGFPVPILWFSIITELLVAVACLYRPRSVGTWLANFLLFSFFLAIASLRMILGYKTCGCGGIELPAYIFVAIDCTVIGMLIFVALKNHNGLAVAIKNGIKWGVELGPEWKGRLAAFLVLGLIVGFLSQTIRTAIFSEAPIRGTADLPTKTLVGDVVEIKVEVENFSKAKAEVVGASRSCACLAVSSVGEEIVVGKAATLRVKVNPQKTGPFHERIIYFVKHPQQFKFFVDVRGFVSKGKSDESFFE